MLNNHESLFLLVICNKKESKQINLLKELFLNVISYNNIEEAKEEIKNNHIDIIVCENSKYINAFNFFEEIKDIKISSLRFVLNEKTDTDDLLKSIELNIDAYLLESSSEEKIKKQINIPINKYLLKNNLFYSEHFDIQKDDIIIVKTDLENNIIYENSSYSKIFTSNKNELFLAKEYTNIIKDIKNNKTNWAGHLYTIDKDNKKIYLKSLIKAIRNDNNEIIEYIHYFVKVPDINKDKHDLFLEIEYNSLSILALINICEYKIFEKFYSKDLIERIERSFISLLEKELNKNKIFKKVYYMGSGKFAILSSFEDFAKSKCIINEYFDSFVNNINKEVLEINNVKYDLNIILSYSFGKYMIYKDTLHGLKEAILENKKIYNANDASLREDKIALNNKISEMVENALVDNRIISHYQAIVNNKTKKIEKYESLVRLIDENNKVLSPIEFLPVSKIYGSYEKITKRVLENSFKMASEMNIDISINLSLKDIEAESTRYLIYSLLNKYKNSAANIIFELLEEDESIDIELIKYFIEKVRRYGVKIALDDFGSGYSSFERVLLYEPDIIKIDGSLIKNIESCESSKNLVETIVLFSKKQNIKTIAEYVENEDIFNILRDLGVDYSQGYYFGKPEDLLV